MKVWRSGRKKQLWRAGGEDEGLEVWGGKMKVWRGEEEGLEGWGGGEEALEGWGEEALH